MTYFNRKLCSLLVVAAMAAPGAAFAGSCTCSDEASGGGNNATVSNNRVTEGNCSSGRVLGYLESIPGIDFAAGATCTYSN